MKTKVKHIFLIIGSLLIFYTLGLSQNPLSPALGFNIFASQNITTSGGDIEGGIAMGNNFTISSGWSQMTCQNAGAGNWYGTVGGTNYGLVLHGLINWIGGGFNVNANGNNNWLKIANLNGATMVQNGQNINIQKSGIQLNANSTNQTTGQVVGTTSIDFVAAFATLTATSNNFAACPNTVTPNYDYGNPNPKLTLSTANSGRNIWHITAAQLTSWQSITFNNQPNSSQVLIINVDASGTLNLPNFPNMAGIGRTEARYIIWNFYNTSTINISGGGMVEGSILAPNATINKTSSNNIEGQIICTNFTQTTGEVHVATYNHNTTTCSIACSNVTNAGAIGSNQSTCSSSYNPSVLTQTAAPSGGSGTLQYQWQISTDNSTWTDISGATAQTYDPPSITATRYYRRGVRRIDCIDYLYSNVVSVTFGITVNAGADKSQCYNSLFIMSPSALNSGESGQWTVVSGTALIDDAWSSTTSVTVAAGQTATLRWSVSKSGCTSVSDDVVLTNTTNCTTTCPPTALNQNGDLESEGTATNFNLTFQGTPARLIDGSNRPTGWQDLYGSTPTNTSTFQGAFYLKKTGAAGNPRSGTHMIYMKGNGFCLGALGGSGNFSCGRTYRFSVWAAAYTNGATQYNAPFMIEFGSSGGSSYNTAVELIAPASTSWNSLNWQRYEFDITIPEGNTADTWAQFYFTSLDDNTGFVIDDVCITALNTGSYADAGADQGGCSNVFTMAANTPASGYTGTWSVASGSATIANANAPNTTVTITSGNAATLRWTVSNGTGCSGFDDVVIGFQTVANISVNNTTICSGNTATLTATGCTGNLLWSTGATTNSITVNPSSTTSYTVTCTPTSNTNLLLNPNFEAAFNLENWSGWGYASATTTPSEIQNGAKAAKVAAGAGGGGLGQNVTASAGQFYTATVWGRVSDPSIGGGVTLEFLNASWSSIGSIYVPFTSNTYTQYVLSATAPIGTARVQIGFWFNQGVTGLVDNCSLVQTYNNCTKTASGTVTVNPSVSITTQPTGFTQCVGGTQSLSVIASNAVSYQWQSSPNNTTWTNISGQTSATYTPPSTTTGTTYYRVVANSASCGSVNSNSATVVIVADPSVTVSGGTTICNGGTATLTATVSNGTGTTTYQWQSSSDNSSFTNISGATNSTYTTSTLTTTTYYRVIVNQTGNGCGTATSTSATVAVVTDPSVMIIADYTTMCSGGTATLTANIANGTGTITYQWQSSTDNSTFNNIAGANNISYTTPVLTTTTYYRVIANQTGLGCDPATATTTITVNPDPTISISGGGTICQGGTITLTSSITGGSTNVTNVGVCTPTASWTTTHPEVEFCTYNLNLTYGQTFNIRDYVHIKDANLRDSVNWSNVYFTYTAAGANDPTNPVNWRLLEFNSGLPVTVTSADNAAGMGNHNQGEYRIYIVRNGQTTFDDHMTIRVNPTTSDLETAKCDGWVMACLYRDRYGSSGGTPLANIDVTVTFADGSSQTVRTNNSGQCFAEGRPGNAIITIDNADIPNGLFSHSGSNTFTINVLPDKIRSITVAYNPTARNFQWQSSTNGTTWSNITNATNSTYAVPTSSIGTMYYRLVVTDNGFNCNASNSVSVTTIVVADPSVTVSGGTTICNGGTATLTATVSNGTGTTTYQWQSSSDNSSFTNISGATNSTYTTSTLTTTTYYRVIVNQTGNGCGTATSASATVAVTTCVGSVGNYVWTDISGDGINNEPASAGLNGITVQLYTSANVLVATTVTANNQSGNPGYYNFVITTSGDYYIKFPLTFGSKIVSPFQTTTAGVDNNSDANPTTGNSPTFTINIMGSGVSKDNPTIDAAYKCNLTASVTSSNVINCTNATTTLTASPSNGVTYLWSNSATSQTQTVSTAGTYTVTVSDVANGCVASANVTVVVTPMATVGNYVWTDTNGNGLNDEPTSAGINNITVQLWNNTTNTLIATTTTASNGGNPGYYQFCVTSNGNYYIKFPTVNGVGRGLTTQTTTAATDNNSDANVTTGQSPVFSLDVNGTGTAKNNMTIDAAYKATCPTGNCVNITITKTK